MKIKYLGQIAIAAFIIMATGCTGFTSSNNSTTGTEAVAKTVANPCAGSNPDASLAPHVAQAQEVEYFTDANGLAIRGSDPVAYFTLGEPQQGSADFEYVWNNVTWRFANAENRDKFAANPERYAPQYGGFCAWAVSQGYTASIDPQAWRIVDGKLYLNYNQRIQRRWERDIPGNIAKADANWPDVLTQ
jgi:YHS domain-containing protein